MPLAVISGGVQDKQFDPDLFLSESEVDAIHAYLIDPYLIDPYLIDQSWMAYKEQEKTK
jgi:hypothetical protein